MACVQVDFVLALLPELSKKSNSCIMYWQNQNKHCNEILYPQHVKSVDTIPTTRSVLFLICTGLGHNQRPLVPKKVPLKKLFCLY
jgi:hypothetical protein